ncbi:glycoside hydrolase family 10 protein [Leptolyngbya sp. FACHB-261]|uniref:glycoside hydrolase family 10 protein n=1 Tax=Leptolyngbya sp. FACHB-261 TaxID=2692806 RepID=UPI0016843DF7|nr:family 10 glycosylhydrolase [Leptolyngbya sp. FACHB-261]MBD2103697.1 family 10 glycosylhydrolase [Leptolyngbya sp. FACHB-261]
MRRPRIRRQSIWRDWLNVVWPIFLCASLVLGLALVSRAQPTLGLVPAAPELRGTWLTNIDSEVLFSAPQTRSALERLKQLNFNTVYPTVYQGGYTLYPSRVAERTLGHRVDPHPGLQRRDMLLEVVRRGHQLGLSVLPWLEFGLMAPEVSTLAARHPDWLTQRQDGSQVVMEGKDRRVWLNPFHPGVQQFMVSLVDELAANYNIDGLQLDDHFGLPVELGYDPYTVQLYRRERGQLPPSDYRDPAWMRWRAEKLTALMRRIFYTLKRRRPRALMALSPNPWEFSYQNYLQDWRDWERRGLVEELIVQVYRSDLERFRLELGRPELQQAASHIPVGVGILAGLKNRLSPSEQIQAQVELARSSGLAGVSFFFYETLAQQDDTLKALFPTPASRPSLQSSPKP